MNMDDFDPAIKASIRDFLPQSDKLNACSFKTSVEELSGTLVSGFVWSVEPKRWDIERLPAGTQAFESQDEVAQQMAEERPQHSPSALEQRYLGTIVKMAAENPRGLLAPAGLVLGTGEMRFYRSKCSACHGDNMQVCRSCNGGKVHCEACHSRGQVNCRSCGGPGTHQRVRTVNGQTSYEYDTCYPCNGTGKQTCSYCSGVGRCNCRQCAGAGINKCSACTGGYQVMKLGYEFSYRPAIMPDRALTDIPSGACVTTFGAHSVVCDEPLKLSFPVTVHLATVRFDFYGEHFEHRFWGQTFAPEDERKLRQRAFAALLGWLSNPQDKAKVKAARSTPIIKNLISQTRSGIKISDVKEVALGSITLSQALQFESHMQAIRKSQGFLEKAFEALTGLFSASGSQAGAESKISQATAYAGPSEASRKQHNTPAQRMGHLKAIWEGRVGTAKLFWLYGVVGSHVGMLLLPLVGRVDKRLSILAALLLISYMIAVTVGAWRSTSSTKSDSSSAMRMLGRLGSVLLGFMLAVTIAAFL